VLLPGVDGEAGTGEGQQDAAEGEHVGVGDHRSVLPPMW
jgi:hypothetical protein